MGEASKTIPNVPSEWHTHTVSSNWFMHMGRKVTGTKKKNTRGTLTFSVVPDTRLHSTCSSDTAVVSSPKGRPSITLEADNMDHDSMGDFTDHDSNASIAEMQDDPLDVLELMEDGSQMALRPSDTIIISSEPHPCETMSQPSFSMLEEVVRPEYSADSLLSEDSRSSE